MKEQITKELSAISRTNQLQILDDTEVVADKLYQYLFKNGRGIESFLLEYSRDKNEDSKEDNSDNNQQSDYYQKRHKYIKKQIKERLEEHNKNVKTSDIQYFLSYYDGKPHVFFSSPDKTHSGWKELFNKNNSNRERIFNLVFKVYLLPQFLPEEIVDGFEELFFVYSKSSPKSKKPVHVWGQNLFINYNYHNVLTLTLTRKHKIFLRQDDYNTSDGDDLGEVLTYEKKNYYFQRDGDARRSNKINFMVFPKDKKDYTKFKQTQLYYYQTLMTRLEEFLRDCKIEFKILDFQADHYLENAFITNIDSVECLEIINNLGTNFNENDQQFFINFLKYKGINEVTFYNLGKTITNYEKIEEEDDTCWKITELIPWENIELDKNKNYLVFNKLLEEETGSMAYQRKDGYWVPSTKIDNQKKVDFYSQLKRKFSYLETGAFFSTQGINIDEFKIIKYQSRNSHDFSILTYSKKFDLDILRLETQAFTDDQHSDIDEYFKCYLAKQKNLEEWEKFYQKYNFKPSSEFEKILIELGIKNWMRKSIVNDKIALPIQYQSCTEKRFWVIYVRSPKKKQTKAVAVEFLYKENSIYVKQIIGDVKTIERKFKFLRRRKNDGDKLINDQQYFVDEVEKIYIRCYTNDYFTPSLIGRHGILEALDNETLELNRSNKKTGSKLLPLVAYYNSDIKPIERKKNMICLDLSNEDFIEYYVPPNTPPKGTIKRGYRVYHLIGKTYLEKTSETGETIKLEETIKTSDLIEHPLTALHFTTLTQNILKINENSQSSLLQKIVRVLIEN